MAALPVLALPLLALPVLALPVLPQAVPRGTADWQLQEVPGQRKEHVNAFDTPP